MTVFIFLGSLLGAMAIGMPIATALLVCGVALMIELDNFDAQILAQNLVSGADSFPLMAVPFFMLAGELMNAGGLSKRIIALAVSLIGHVRGGLGYVAVIAALVMASISGSAVADTAALAAILLPMMKQAGYRLDRCCGLIASGGIIAPVIPPSIGFVVFGVAAGVSITRLFLAGIFPGLLMGLALVITWYIIARDEPVARSERASAREVAKTALDGVWALALPLLIIGGMKAGAFTPTEAAVVAAVYAGLVGYFIYGELKFGDIRPAMLSALKTSAAVMFLVAAALVSAWLITIADIPGEVARLLGPLIDNKTLLMLAMMLLVIVVGTALDFIPTVLILTPVLMPIVKQAGIDPVYFGVMFIVNNAIGLLTPPVGTVLNVVCAVGNISMDKVIKGVMPFLLAQIFVLALLIFIPELVTVPAKFFYGR
ncbi:L-dehydroascorbate transporter large permease subunit [Bosea caraganae]|uniref:TRAP transporter large permease protein n=1 Tax=Bosea caraganae TaxID=2763117 RepID=A0A370L728_9HYPH|nr:TRAP transporter large permease subunit [Bosea caraganae]RDJ25401.1 L-dehydroascorbate transporter large permease subunit [Bosea caraganae]RDJ25814.1 L-dehydroascorbate transporter large permease subunit [Bosea caraganae]